MRISETQVLLGLAQAVPTECPVCEVLRRQLPASGVDASCRNTNVSSGVASLDLRVDAAVDSDGRVTTLFVH